MTFLYLEILVDPEECGPNEVYHHANKTDYCLLSYAAFFFLSRLTKRNAHKPAKTIVMTTSTGITGIGLFGCFGCFGFGHGILSSSFGGHVMQIDPSMACRAPHRS